MSPAPHRVPADSHLAIFSGLEPPLGQRAVQRETLGLQHHTAGRDLGNCHFASFLWVRKLSSKYPRSHSKLVSVSEQIHWQASWPLNTPSGQDVSLSEEESLPESPFVSGRRTLLIFSWLSHYNLLINAIDLCTEFRHVKTT